MGEWDATAISWRLDSLKHRLPGRIREGPVVRADMKVLELPRAESACQDSQHTIQIRIQLDAIRKVAYHLYNADGRRREEMTQRLRDTGALSAGLLVSMMFNEEALH